MVVDDCNFIGVTAIPFKNHAPMTIECTGSGSPLDYLSLRRAPAGRWICRMQAKLTFKYDREADILYINKCPPYPEQESEELGGDVIARLNPATGEVENVEVLFFSTRLLRDNLFELPIKADLRLPTNE